MSAKAASTSSITSQVNTPVSEHDLALMVQMNLHHFADGHTLVAHRHKQGAEVLHGADEDAADQDPQQHGHPAEQGRLNGAVDGAGARDGREVVTQQNGGLGGHVVHAVLHFVSRGLMGRVNAPLFCQPAAVEDVT